MLKGFNFSLSDKKNYNQTFKKDLFFYLREYIVLMKEFIEYFNKYIEPNNNKKYYVVFKGLQSITHIFLILLLYTKNLSLTLYHCKKSFLYYVEFISQIGDEGNSYLQLNSKDAILFIYKKSIFDINNEYRQLYESSDNDEEMIRDIKKFTKIFNNIYSICTIKIVEKGDKSVKNLNNIITKLVQSINKKRENDELLFDKILVYIDFLDMHNIENFKFLEVIKLLIKRKKFILLTCEKLENKLRKPEAIMNLEYDSYKKIVDYIMHK